MWVRTARHRCRKPDLLLCQAARAGFYICRNHSYCIGSRHVAKSPKLQPLPRAKACCTRTVSSPTIQPRQPHPARNKNTEQFLKYIRALVPISSLFAPYLYRSCSQEIAVMPSFADKFKNPFPDLRNQLKGPSMIWPPRTLNISRTNSTCPRYPSL